MINMINQLFGWMPPILAAVCIGIVAIFTLVTVLKVIKLILDVIPFL